MAKKKIYKHHQRTTIASAISDAQERELVVGLDNYQAAITFSDGKTLKWPHYADIRSFGAVGDGVADDTTAIQNAIASGSKHVFAPSGTYRITSTILIQNKRGFVFEGEGKDSTVFIWGGASGGTMMTMRGAIFNRLAGFTLDMNDLANTGLYLPCYDTASGDTLTWTQNEIRDISISDALPGTTSIALRVGDTVGTQLDNLTVYKCSFANAARLCTIQGNVTFIIGFIDTSFSGDRSRPTEVFVDIADRCGGIWFNGACQFVGSGPTVAIIRRDNISGTVTFNGCQSENVGVFFVGLEDSGFSNINPVEFCSSVIGTNAEDATLTCAITNTSTTATLGVGASELQLMVGRLVTGTGIPAGTRITAIATAGAETDFTLSQAATATNATASLTIHANSDNVSLNSTTTVTVTELSRYRVGKHIWGTGIPSTTVSSFIANTSITLSAACTVTNSDADLYLDTTTRVSVGTTAGSAVVTCTDTTGVSNGMRASGVGVPATTVTAKSAVSGAGTITLSAAATATNANATVTMKPNVIDYQQRGAVIIRGGLLSSSYEGDAVFSGPGTKGSIGGLVSVTGGRYKDHTIAFLTSGASQLNEVKLTGDVALNDRWAISGATGSVEHVGQTTHTGDYIQTGDNTVTGLKRVQAAAKGRIILARTNNAVNTEEVANFEAVGPSSTGVSRIWSNLQTIVDDATNASEDASVVLNTIRAGAQVEHLKLKAGELTILGVNQGAIVAKRTNNVGATSEPGTFNAVAPNDLGVSTIWSRLSTIVEDATSGSEDALVTLRVVRAGAEVDAMVVGASVPATATSTGTKGMICWDTTHVYFCVATDTWRRVAIATW